MTGNNLNTTLQTSPWQREEDTQNTSRKTITDKQPSSLFLDEMIAKLERFSKYTFYVANNNGADQTARMRRLLRTFVVRIHEIGFLAMRSR